MGRMKRMALGIGMGLAIGLLVAPSAPQADKEDATLRLLCQRFESTGGATLSSYARMNKLDVKSLRGDQAGLPPESRAVLVVMRDLRDMFCVK